MTKGRAIGVVVAGLALVGGLMWPALAGSPGPNGHNTAGLCQAYRSGSDQGQAQKQDHGAAFVALEAAAKAWDEADDANSTDPAERTEQNESTQEQVAEYCAANS